MKLGQISKSGRPARHTVSRRNLMALALASTIASTIGLPAIAQEVPVEKLVTIVAENGRSFTRTFNPFSPTSRWVAKRTIYEPLMIQNFATGELEPWLATDYAWSDDNLSLDVTLRDGVLWSDGEAFSADDVIFTFNLMRDNAGLIGPATGVFSDYLAGVEAVDDKTVRFTFTKPYSPGLYTLVDQFIVPEHAWSDVADPVSYADEEPVGTGPFTTIAAFGSQQYQVTQNPHYWQELNIEGVNVPAFNGNDHISASVLSGQIDWGGLVPDPDITFVPLDPEHFGYWWPRTSVVYLEPNTTLGALADVNVRKAMSMALDRQRMINTGVWGKSVPANATGLPLGPYQSWVDQSVVDNGTWLDLNIEASNALLDEAGYPLGSDGVRVDAEGKPLAFDIIVPNGWNDWVSASQIVSENLQEIGLKVTLRTPTSDSWTNSTFTGQFELSLASVKATATPFDFYKNNITTRSVAPVGTASAINQQRYGDPVADELIEAFAASTDEATQKEKLVELQALFSEAAPLIPLYEQPDWGLYNTRRISGFPNEANPYAPLTLQMNNTPLLVWPHLTYTAE
ncbi:ABC transporter substrate-binding protein [Devosia sp. YIM 151766]|uniref:ABC transporter substrate-binding protein n=1 Tax=Devosia sp. YIM 151766 TaxID=3017325 RepID=UPI00255CE0EF|nr:ABC transporter substrate-binding protein [Devosia sp. YIM 151766]WIY53871.1 ABC transporter substrate-binding protein [Devosia sp. YIM 151766]